MARAIKMPDLGTTVDKVTLINWLKQEGEAVDRGDALCEVQTDKAVNEVESIAKGVLLRQAVSAGEEIEQGTVIAYVGAPGEEVAGTVEQPQQPESAAKPADTAQPQKKETDKVKIPPLLRNLAKKEGVDLTRVVGTGPGGRITREDIVSAKESAPAAENAIELPVRQKTIARRVAQSQREIPAINFVAQIEMSRVISLRQRLIEEAGRKITYDAIFACSVGQVMKEFPHFRSWLTGEKFTTSDGANIGIAVGFDHELYIPVVKNADSKAIAEIDSEIQQLVEKARQTKLSLDEMTGATFTISNLGMLPVQSFNMIIPPDQVGSLAIGSIETVPVMKGETITSAKISSITLSVDHRLINGREAAEFLARLKQHLETL